MPAPDLSRIAEQANVIGADGVHVGTVDHVIDGRLKLTRIDSSDGHHHFIDGGLVADIEDGTVRLSANADVAVQLLAEDANDGDPDADRRLEEGLEETFPASDPVSAKHIT